MAAAADVSDSLTNQAPVCVLRAGVFQKEEKKDGSSKGYKKGPKRP